MVHQLVHAGLVLLAIGCQSATSTPPVPIPENAEGVRVMELGNGHTQVSFRVQAPYPSQRVRDFYSDWATAEGWIPVPREVDRWSVDEWVSVRDVSGAQTDMWTVRWRARDGERGLGLALLYRANDLETQEVYVFLGPFYLVDPADSPRETLGDYLKDPRGRSEQSP